MYKQAKDYHYLYDTARWKRLRLQQLQTEPLCRYCMQAGTVTEATICDHIEPHKGNHDKFFDTNNYMSLCKRCHDSDKAILERAGRRKAIIGNDGWPIDLNNSSI
jgi:5-methylcytosine-specific restriction enzyme A